LPDLEAVKSALARLGYSRAVGEIRGLVAVQDAGPCGLSSTKDSSY